ncbi:MAG: hypothetical protein RL037_2166, partial [Bacteroidota bacterium]
KNNTGSIRVMSLNGQFISTSNITNGLQYIDLNSKSSGLHFLYISDGSSTTIKKIIKM